MNGILCEPDILYRLNCNGIFVELNNETIEKIPDTTRIYKTLVANFSKISKVHKKLFLL
jgi:hypothetical protein